MTNLTETGLGVPSKTCDPSVMCPQHTVELRRRQIKQLIDFWGSCRDVAAPVGLITVCRVTSRGNCEGGFGVAS